MNAVFGVALVMSLSAAPRHSSSEILRDLRKLSVLGGALYVAAHPDDENTRLLASLANGAKVRTAYLSLTRGEGGQNLIGPELGPLLGVIRTQELLAARRVDGAEQFFTSARDFGYSKSVEETMTIWGKDRIVSDAVRVIRSMRPDVIITRFPQEAGDTHGHHTASARVALEAFTKAADPAYVIEGTTPWQAKRIVWNAWSRDDKDIANATMKANSSAFDPLLGVSYGEMAAESRSMHKSQGFGAAPIHGPSPEQFVLLAGSPGTSLFDGVDLSWKRVAGAEKVAALLKKAADEFKEPVAAIPTLLLALDAMRALPENPYKAQKLAELTSVITNCAGVFLEATASSFTAVSGGSLDVSTTALNRSSAAVSLKSVAINGTATVVDAKLLDGLAQTQKLTTSVSSMQPSNPAWLLEAPEIGTWNVSNALVNSPEARPAFTAEFTLIVDGRTLTVTRPVVFKWVDPTVGERYRPIEVSGAVLVKTDASLMVFDSAAPKALKVTVTAMADGQEGQVHAATPPTLYEGQKFSLKKKGDTAELTFMVDPKVLSTRAVIARVGDNSYSHDLKRIEYPHIPIQTVSPRAEVKLARIDMVKGKKRIGYIAGAGDEVAESLRRVGYEVTQLNEAALLKPLSGFDAIVVGIRAYNVNPRMPTPALMTYVANGGTLLVQYNTKNWLSNVPAEMGPYPFEVTQDRVTDENAEVTFALPKHRVLNTPNKLSADDFKGWVQERGLYFADKLDPKYETPLSMHDAGEDAKKGSLVIAKHGKGTFIYTGLSFFRQLPAGVPGAYRLFANLLAANGN